MILRKLYYLHRIRKNPWKSKEELEKLQLRKLRMIIRHAFEKVPYYHGIFRDNGILPDDIKALADLHKIPVTTKADLQGNWSQFIAKGYDDSNCRIRYTSGSTGNPHKLYFDMRADDYGHATDLRSMYENGYSFRKSMLEMTHPRHISSMTMPQRLGIHKLKLVSVFDTPEVLLKSIEQCKPEFVKGYPSKLRAIASHMGSPRELGIRKIFTTSELLSAADKRLISRRFATDVIDLYGSVEFPRVAWECDKHEGYHLDIDSVAFELTKDGKSIGTGQGDITITGLYNKAMPLIRYNIGDIGRMEQDARCSCGRNFPLLHSIRGRCNDRIMLRSGREVDPLTLYNVEHLMGVRKFRIVQEKPDLFTVKYTTLPGVKCSADKSFRNAIKAACGKDRVRVRVDCVSELPPDPSGKFRSVISKVKSRRIP